MPTFTGYPKKRKAPAKKRKAPAKKRKAPTKSWKYDYKRDKGITTSIKYPRPTFESVELGTKNYKIKKFNSQAEYDKQIKRDVIAVNKTREKDFSHTGIRRPKMTAKKLKAEYAKVAADRRKHNREIGIKKRKAKLTTKDMSRMGKSATKRRKKPVKKGIDWSTK